MAFYTAEDREAIATSEVYGITYLESKAFESLRQCQVPTELNFMDTHILLYCIRKMVDRNAIIGLIHVLRDIAASRSNFFQSSLCENAHYFELINIVLYVKEIPAEETLELMHNLVRFKECRKRMITSGIYHALADIPVNHKEHLPRRAIRAVLSLLKELFCSLRPDENDYKILAEADIFSHFVESFRDEIKMQTRYLPQFWEGKVDKLPTRRYRLVVNIEQQGLLESWADLFTALIADVQKLEIHRHEHQFLFAWELIFPIALKLNGPLVLQRFLTLIIQGDRGVRTWFINAGLIENIFEQYPLKPVAEKDDPLEIVLYIIHRLLQKLSPHRINQSAQTYFVLTLESFGLRRALKWDHPTKLKKIYGEITAMFEPLLAKAYEQREGNIRRPKIKGSRLFATYEFGESF
ncbi:uncharacterized protein LOC111269335 [Varroa jacobsoni]|uniref:Uncharacterized protein n=1 Tax=Varroa destructor TaxID=109461 RepID=A0A7M7KA27_VARDE|nr:uncharacterized protein LOC111248993 [Varroa destructor]XP_022704573.1 uncharacterized protein LOC111269335 [Varroa jacobsoni]